MCDVSVTADNLDPERDYEVFFYEDGQPYGYTYPLFSSKGTESITQTMKKAWSTTEPGIGIYLRDRNSGETLAQIDPFDFPDSAAISALVRV
ncbi:MAG: hypothetical protein Q4P71_01255 [Actinomycetaceae bacterium]|nr:hypothetical protein [Actinomycetaceae bacterium]